MIVIKDDDWDYLAEGGRHILLKYRGYSRPLQYHVLRFEKITQTDIKESKILPLCSKYIETVIKPWLPQYTCSLPVTVTIQFESFSSLLTKLNFHRPFFRKEEKSPLLPPLEGEIIRDITVTMLPLFRLQAMSNNSRDTEINYINDHLNHFINFEFKVKCGLKSCSPFVSKQNQWIKYNLSDFAITQLSRLGGRYPSTLVDEVKEIVEISGSKITCSSCQPPNAVEDSHDINTKYLTAATSVKDESKEGITATPTAAIFTFDSADVSALGDNRTEKSVGDSSRCIGQLPSVTQSTTFLNSSTVLPPSTLNSPMKQYSRYDPSDLCSRDLDKVKSAIEHLYETPNNNFKVSVGGKSFFDCFHNDMQDVITAFNNIAQSIDNDSSNAKIDKMSITNLLGAILCEETILEMLAALQALAIVDVEGSFAIFGRLCHLLGTREGALAALESATLQPFDPEDFKIIYLLRIRLSALMASENLFGDQDQDQQSINLEGCGCGSYPMASIRSTAITVLHNHDIGSNIFTVESQPSISNSIQHKFGDVTRNRLPPLPLMTGDTSNCFGINLNERNHTLLELIHSMTVLACEQHLAARNERNAAPSAKDTLAAIPNDTISFRIHNWISELDVVSCVMLLRMWLLGLTASDASVMVCLSLERVAGSESLEARSSPHNTVGSSAQVTRCQSEGTAGEVSLENHGGKNFHFAYTISILDVGPKPVTKILEKFEKENLKCSMALKSAAFLFT